MSVLVAMLAGYGSGSLLAVVTVTGWRWFRSVRARRWIAMHEARQRRARRAIERGELERAQADRARA